MKNSNLIPIVILLGLTVLFFFPEPETNFLAYFGTALIFIIAIISLIIESKNREINK